MLYWSRKTCFVAWGALSSSVGKFRITSVQAGYIVTYYIAVLCHDETAVISTDLHTDGQTEIVLHHSTGGTCCADAVLWSYVIKETYSTLNCNVTYAYILVFLLLYYIYENRRDNMIVLNTVQDGKRIMKQWIIGGSQVDVLPHNIDDLGHISLNTIFPAIFDFFDLGHIYFRNIIAT